MNVLEVAIITQIVLQASNIIVSLACIASKYFMICFQKFLYGLEFAANGFYGGIFTYVKALKEGGRQIPRPLLLRQCLEAGVLFQCLFQLFADGIGDAAGFVGRGWCADEGEPGVALFGGLVFVPEKQGGAWVCFVGGGDHPQLDEDAGRVLGGVDDEAVGVL